MREKEAMEIYGKGVQFTSRNKAPEEMTKRFYQAIGYLEAIGKAELLVEALKYVSDFLEFTKAHNYVEYIKTKLAQWEKER